MSTVESRWHQYVSRRQDHQCWPWTGSLAVRGGYGQLQDRGKLLKAHRVAWEIHFGPIPEGMFIRHMCHNPRCCNPSHLLPGTVRDNNRDAVKSKRNFVPEPLRGEEQPNSRLTADDVRLIRSCDEDGAVLAARYGVSKSTISHVRLRKTWKHV